MKRLYIICVATLFYISLYAQGEPPSSPLKNLAPPNSPAFVLMDVTPSSIVVPENIQSFSIQTINAFTGNSNNGLSNNNFALEFQPYWYVKREEENFFKYNNLTVSKAVVAAGGTPTVDDYTGYNVFGDIWKKASFSLALMNGDFEVFNEPQSFVSIGARTRLITVRSLKQINKFKNQYKNYVHFMSNGAVPVIIGNGSMSLEEKNEAIINLPGYKSIEKDFESLIEEKPVFALDMAIAYSHFMGNNEQEFDDAFGRFGIWLSGDLAIYTPTINEKSYIHFYGIFRFLKDGINLNEESNELFSEDKIDFGGKIEFELNRISFAYEYVTRDSENDDESRSIGSIRYRINDDFALNGGFGENFKSEGNGIVLLGIEWGIDNGSSVKLTPN